MADLTEVEKMFKQICDGICDKNIKKENDKKHYMFNQKNKWKCKNIPKLNVDKIREKNQISKKSPINNNNNNNAETKSLDDYMNVFDSFRSVLNDIQVDEESRPKIVTKLKSIQKVIQIKIKHLTFEDKLNMDLLSESSSLSENLPSIFMQSLCSEGSLSSVSSQLSGIKGESYEEFLSRISCPFCSELQIDKIHFIKHLDQDCQSFRNKIFSKKYDRIPYSEFQILPSNTIKCNVCSNSVSSSIKLYFIHKTSFQHKDFKSRSNKKYTEDLFCSSCKMLIPNTYKQLKCHINHPEHTQRCDETDIVDLLSSKGVSLAYIHSRRFKCIVCYQIVKPTFSDLLIHCETKNHRQNLKKWFRASDVIHCKKCDVEYEKLSEFEYHLRSEKHKLNDRQRSREEESYELCFYCGFKTPDLMKLSTHMTYGCDEIGSIRDSSNVKSDEKYLKDNAIENKKESAVDVTELKSNGGTDEHRIWIKGCNKTEKLFKVFKFFRVLGEMDVYKFCENGKTLMIQFKQRGIVDKVLAKRKAIDVELDVEIISNPDWDESETDDQEADTTDSDSASSSEDDDLADWSWGNQDLQSLFQRVSSRLLKLSQKPDDTDQQIAQDCALTLKCKKCILLGFRAEELSFPTDSISLFCDFEGSHSKNKKNLSLLEHSEFTDVLIKCHGIISNSKLWEDVEVIKIPWPCIKCKHVETQKTCTVSFHSAFVELTDMLGEILVQNESFRPFCLIIRLWFAVKKFSLGDSDYPLMSLIIFFLINSRMASLKAASNSMHKKISFMAMNETSEVSTETVQALDIWELFKNFLRFLQNFDFSKNAICFPLNHPVRKQLLKSPWFKHSSEILETAYTNDYLCIMDSLCSINFGLNVNEEDFQSILKTAKETVKHYEL